MSAKIASTCPPGSEITSAPAASRKAISFLHGRRDRRPGGDADVSHDRRNSDVIIVGRLDSPEAAWRPFSEGRATEFIGGTKIVEVPIRRLVGDVALCRGQILHEGGTERDAEDDDAFTVGPEVGDDVGSHLNALGVGSLGGVEVDIGDEEGITDDARTRRPLAGQNRPATRRPPRRRRHRRGQLHRWAHRSGRPNRGSPEPWFARIGGASHRRDSQRLASPSEAWWRSPQPELA